MWENRMGSKGVLLVGDCPVGLEFGVDTIAYETGPKFKGIASIPYGVHLVYYSYGGFQREGFFLSIDRHVQVIAWDGREERFTAQSALSGEEEAQHEQEILSGALNSCLAPYPQKQYESWLRLTRHISPTTLTRCHCPPLAHIVSDIEEVDDSRQQLVQGQQVVVSYSPLKEMEQEGLRRAKQQDTSPSLLTAMGMDRSWLLEQLVDHQLQTDCGEVLAEMQLSFLLFLCLHSQSGLNQWKALVTLAVECGHFLLQHEDFAINLIQILYAQLSFVPEDFFEVDLIGRESFLLPALRTLCSALAGGKESGVGLGEDLLEHRNRFLNFLAKRFGLEISLSEVDLMGEASTPSLPFSALPPALQLDITEQDHQALQLQRPNFLAKKRMAVGESGEGEAVKARWELINQSLGIALSGERPEYMEEADVDMHSSAPQQQPEERKEEEQIDLPEISVRELEGSKYCWRYPLLYEEMRRSGGREDMIMTAMRIVDDHFSQAGSTPSEESGVNGDGLVIESLSFIENESSAMIY
eukprot:gene3717-4066_t